MQHFFLWATQKALSHPSPNFSMSGNKQWVASCPNVAARTFWQAGSISQLEASTTFCAFRRFFFSECRAMNLFAAACKLSTASSPEFQHVSAATTISETRTNGQSCLDNLQLRSEVSTSSGHPIPLKQVDRSQRHELSFLQTKSGPSFWESRCRNLVAHAKVSSRQLKFAGWS